MVKIVHLRIDYNKCVGLLEGYDVCLAGVFDAEETIAGKRALVARPEDCTECEQCAQVCSTNAIELVEDKEIIRMHSKGRSFVSITTDLASIEL